MLVLQTGSDDWSRQCQLPDDVQWQFVDINQPVEDPFIALGRVNVTVIDGTCPDDILEAIAPHITPHTLLVTEWTRPRGGSVAADVYARKVAHRVDGSNRQELIATIAGSYYVRQFGQKLAVNSILVPPGWTTEPTFVGATGVTLEVNSPESRQAVAWRESIKYEAERDMDLWLEYTTEGDVEVVLTVQHTKAGTSDVILSHTSHPLKDVTEPILFSSDNNGYLSCSLELQGSGSITVGPLHYRHSRGKAGYFFPGGQRLVDSNREEIFHYFHPGNLKPPLTVYFAGYRPAEGFEGNHMMEGLGQPFLLFTDPRLDGGRFYLGSQELEDGIRRVIRDRLESLGFTERDLIVSGLSMGAFGALYYGSQFDSHAIIVGKPIIDLPYVARQTRLTRPEDFLTVLDMVNFWKQQTDGQDTTPEGFTEGLISRWKGDIPGKNGLDNTKMLLAYMMHDDYDNEAYQTLLTSQSGKPTEIIARGYQGRHNDDSPSIVTWFINQYRRVLGEYQAAHPQPVESEPVASVPRESQPDDAQNTREAVTSE